MLDYRKQQSLAAQYISYGAVLSSEVQARRTRLCIYLSLHPLPLKPALAK